MDMIATLGFGVRALLPFPRLRVRELLDQIWIQGIQATPTVLFSLTILTTVMILELSFHMALIIRQDAMVPSFAAMLLIRELGPVVAAMLVASRSGAAMSAELATLKVTGQIDALILSRIDIKKFLVRPRIIGAAVSHTALTVLSVTGALVLSGLITATSLGITPQLFLGNLFLFTESQDITVCLVKALVFGTLIPTVACYSGLQAEPSTRGVGQAATQSVVRNSVWIIILDYCMSWGWYA